MDEVRRVDAWIVATQRGTPVDAPVAHSPIRLSPTLPDLSPFDVTVPTVIVANPAAIVRDRGF